MAANNNTFIESLGAIYKTQLPDVSFDPKECRIQCFPHVINTCVQHAIKSLNNGINTDYEDLKAKKDSDDEKSNSESEGSDGEEGDGEGSNDGGGGSTKKDIAVSKVPDDPLNKVWALVRGICASG
jgi:hypothetical protein